MSNENEPIGNIEWLNTYDLALEDRVTCDGAGCPNPATHYITTRCCGEVVLCCRTCLEIALNTLLAVLARGRMLECKICKEESEPKGFFSKPKKL